MRQRSTGRASAAVGRAPRSTTARVGAGSKGRQHAGLGPDVAAVLSLQRDAGNRAVAGLLSQPGGGTKGEQTRMVALPLGGFEHPLAASVDHPDVNFRLPTFADLRAAYRSKELKIPEAVVQARVGELLTRMKREKRLKTDDPVPDILARIFPAPGVISEAEFLNTLDASDRNNIYVSVLDADTKVKKVDKPKLRAAMKDAAAIIKTVEGDAAGLTAVFGTKAATAKAVYGRAHSSMLEMSRDMDKKVTTDYNLDDPQVQLGGWASSGLRHMHLLLGVAQVVDPAKTKTTLIHEASHLADSSVTDKGYYATPSFEALDEDTKVTNAAHFEELPRRILGTSSFAGITFTPGVKAGGAAVTWEDTVRRGASEHLRQAWSTGVDVHEWIRAIRVATLKGRKKPFEKNRAALLDASRRMNLTIHDQNPRHARVTSLDVALSESVARGVALIGGLVRKEAVVHPMGPWLDPADETKAAESILINAAIASYGALLGDPRRDRELVDWFASGAP